MKRLIIAVTIVPEIAMAKTKESQSGASLRRTPRKVKRPIANRIEVKKQPQPQKDPQSIFK